KTFSTVTPNRDKPKRRSPALQKRNPARTAAMAKNDQKMEIATSSAKRGSLKPAARELAKARSISNVPACSKISKGTQLASGLSTCPTCMAPPCGSNFSPVSTSRKRVLLLSGGKVGSGSGLKRLRQKKPASTSTAVSTCKLK